MQPNFLIIGALRSGTTSLARYLGAHPDVFMAPQKEVRYFDQNFDRGWDWYVGQFAGADSARAIGEASPGYMYYPAALDRMATALPEARLLAILRDPVDRAWSEYWLRRALGQESRTFREAVARDSDYLARGRYLPQLLNVCARYPRERLQVILFEDLRDSPARTYQAICRFLEVPDTVLPPIVGRVINPYVNFRSVRLRRLSKRLPRLVQRVIGRLNTKRGMYPALPRAERVDLRARFEQDNANLAAWLGRDLSAWDS